MKILGKAMRRYFSVYSIGSHGTLPTETCGYWNPVLTLYNSMVTRLQSEGVVSINMVQFKAGTACNFFFLS